MLLVNSNLGWYEVWIFYVVWKSTSCIIDCNVHPDSNERGCHACSTCRIWLADAALLWFQSVVVHERHAMR